MVLAVQVFGGGTSAHERNYQSMQATVKAALDSAKVPENERGSQTIVGAQKLEAHCGAFQVLALDRTTASRTVQEMTAYLKGKGWRDNVRSGPKNVRLIRDDWRFSIHTSEPPPNIGTLSPPKQIEVQVYVQSDAHDCRGRPPAEKRK
ncbi:hypothetical protein ABZS95_36920 [Streptomyces sp. NPDC005479]|uniref:hypothetical protein n=1 Tax=Streptomyces sp. NPDC005479 TaxID=3154879 RepID=UPI0033BF0C49